MNKSIQKQISVLENLITKLKRTMGSVDVTVQSKAVIAHLQLGFTVVLHYEREFSSNGKPGKYTGRTFCVLKRGNTCYLGISSQSFSDTIFNRKRGRLIAASRAFYEYSVDAEAKDGQGRPYVARDNKFMFTYAFGNPPSDLRTLRVPPYLYKEVPKIKKKPMSILDGKPDVSPATFNGA